MSEDAIVVQGLSKRYLVGHHKKTNQYYKYSSLRDVLGREIKSLFRKTADVVRGRQVVQGDEVEEFWALTDISFEVKRGEVLGIVGRNGAGKSTLLKILSRITEPTRGRVLLRGRVSSLLEVGTGFHPELTGRENVFLSGAILGMAQHEIRRKFDEIVAFAEVEKFLDTPVKHYSSGMFVRLAFAVAAHLEPEILIVDEVLAVGDTEFQKKCLGKMGDFSRHSGRTVLFVSHNIASISELTHRALLLERGEVAAIGPTKEVVSKYISIGRRHSSYIAQPTKGRLPHLSRAEVVTSDLNNVQRFGEPMEVRFWVRHETPISKACFSFQIINQFQQPAVHAWALHPEVRFGNREGETLLVCKFPSVRLNVGQFHFRVVLSGFGELFETLDSICPFEVIQTEQSRMWEWVPSDCTYHEKWHWAILAGEPADE